jgi:hypothetical protein
MRSLIKVAGGSIRGRSHEKEGKPCQDCYATWRSKNKKLAGISLSDGAGSSSFSQIGARYCTKAIIEYVEANFEHIFADPTIAGKVIIKYLLIGLKEICSASNLNIGDLASTLLFAFVRRKHKITQYLAGHIGDGAIIIGEGKDINLLSKPERGEYANSTFFITSKNAELALRIYSGQIKGPMGFIIMSDGAGEALYIRKSKNPNQIFCQQIFNWCNYYSQRKINRIIDSNLKKGIFRDVTTDDCSIAVLKIT